MAFEAAEDARADGCVLAEFRIAPLLFEAHGLQGEAAVEALLAGLARSALPCGLIVCAMRHEPPEDTLRAARLAVRYAGRGVVGFDLAGAEAGHPPAQHAARLRRGARRRPGPDAACRRGRRRRARARSRRAGRDAHRPRRPPASHDTRQTCERARALGLHLEVCPTSNVHTGAARSLAAHPLHAMLQAGLSVSVSTDNRLMSGVSLSSELQALHQVVGLGLEQIGQMNRAAAAASFMPKAVREVALRAISAS